VRQEDRHYGNVVCKFATAGHVLARIDNDICLDTQDDKILDGINDDRTLKCTAFPHVVQFDPLGARVTQWQDNARRIAQQGKPREWIPLLSRECSSALSLQIFRHISPMTRHALL